MLRISWWDIMRKVDVLKSGIETLRVVPRRGKLRWNGHVKRRAQDFEESYGGGTS